MKKLFLFIGCTLMLLQLHAQQDYRWYTPTWVEGVCLQDTAHIFHRLPAYMQQQVRKPVWNLSLNTAGEFLHFRTTARSVTVRYVTADKQFSMPHMPATGVSGVDLYATDMDGNWNWAPPEYSFGDTCTFTFRNLYVDAGSPMADFYLYLPLYNTVKWIAVGVPQDQRFVFVPAAKEKPIVAYGTSILQGAVASRSGLAWTNILARNLDRTVINLGFSGNGQLEKPIFDLMGKTDAALYILDCMPNLTKYYHFPDKKIKQRVYDGIRILREAHPEVPVILTEHADGNMPFNMDTALRNEYHNASLLIAGIFEQLKKDGVRNIYLLTDKEIGFGINSTTEGTHANDIGMMQYAAAYEKLIRQILGEPIGNVTTERPVKQSRDGYDWLKRHEEVIANTINTKPRVMLFGNSIINYWSGLPVAESGIERGKASWQKYMLPLQVQNAGFGWDRIENLLWRVYHGELDNFEGNKILVMIGTNNLELNTDDEMVDGLSFLLQQMRVRKPGTQIIMVGLLPRKGMEDRVMSVNQKIKMMTQKYHFSYAGFSDKFLSGSKINTALFMDDGLHPNEKGYMLLGQSLKAVITRLIR